MKIVNIVCKAAVTVALLLTLSASSWGQTSLDNAPVGSQTADEAARARGGPAQPAACRDTTPHKVTFVEVEPGGMRELHWHPNTDEWQYYIEGQARMGVFAASGQARTFDFLAGDVGYVPFAMGHYVENTGTTPLRFLEMFKSSYYADLSLDTWMALTPPKLLQAHVDLDRTVMDALRKKVVPIVPG